MLFIPPLLSLLLSFPFSLSPCGSWAGSLLASCNLIGWVLLALLTRLMSHSALLHCSSSAALSSLTLVPGSLKKKKKSVWFSRFVSASVGAQSIWLFGAHHDICRKTHIYIKKRKQKWGGKMWDSLAGTGNLALKLCMLICPTQIFKNTVAYFCNPALGCFLIGVNLIDPSDLMINKSVLTVYV